MEGDENFKKTKDEVKIIENFKGLLFFIIQNLLIYENSKVALEYNFDKIFKFNLCLL